MAHSIVVCGERHAIFHDSEILLLVGLIRANTSESDGPSLARLFDWWESAAAYVGPGCFDFGLERVNESQKRILSRVLETVENQLRQRFEPLSLQEANGYLLREDWPRFHTSYDSQRLLAAVHRLKGLLAPDSAR